MVLKNTSFILTFFLNIDFKMFGIFHFKNSNDLRFEKCVNLMIGQKKKKKKTVFYLRCGLFEGVKSSKHAFTLDSVYFLLGIFFTRAGDFCLFEFFPPSYFVCSGLPKCG